MARLPRKRLVLRLLPITIFVAVLMLGVRVGDLWHAIAEGGRLPGVSPLQAAGQGASKPQGGGHGGGGGGGDAKKKPENDAPTPPGGPLTLQSPTGVPDPGAEPTPEEKVETLDMEVLKRLAERRAELDRRGRELDQREALMAAAETRLNQKLAELQDVRGEIQKLLHQVDDRQKAQLESLVKIYETMKPKEAARIFEALDQPVLLDVIERMKEAKAAPVLAAMDPMKAREITAALAERRRLPVLPQ
ncbi:MAG: hypothetical protein GC191_15020 [Azospirillum sp.]|nr:hypothetical protein [Azospirillum sp.]